MIVVERLGLLFVHIPQTGGTAVRTYLSEHFGGTVAGPHHGHRVDHLDPQWRSRQWRTVASVRHPMDLTVSSYFKQRNDHHGTYKDGTIDRRRRRQTERAQSGATFDEWFLRHRRRVFAPSWLSTVRNAHDVLRFESLESDLVAMLSSLTGEEPPPLASNNVTNRPDSYARQYSTPKSQARAVRIFSPFMAEFGYPFPAEWDATVPLTSRIEYEIGHRVRFRLLRPADQRPQS